MRRWVEQLRAELSGHTPGRSAALTPEHQRIQELEARLQKVFRGQGRRSAWRVATEFRT